MGNSTEKQAQYAFGNKIQQNKKSAGKSNKKQSGTSEKTNPKWAYFHKQTPKLPLAINFNRKTDIKFEKEQSTKQKSAKSKPKKQANFNQNKPKNKEPASLQM